jgi:hypothetical protein
VQMAAPVRKNLDQPMYYYPPFKASGVARFYFPRGE